MSTPAPLPFTARVKDILPRAGVWLIPAAAFACVLAASAGHTASYLCALVTTTLATGGYTTGLVARGRLARARRDEGGQRSARHLAAGVGTVGLTAVAVIVLALVNAGTAIVAGATVAGLIASSIMFGIGLMYLLPGAARDAVARARHALEGVSVGLCLAAARAMVLPAMPRPPGSMRTTAVMATSLIWVVVPLAASVALRTARRRAASALSATGVAVAVVGIGLLAFSADNPAPTVVISVAAVALVGGPALIRLGPPAPGETPVAAEARDATGTLAGHPMLFLPTLLAVAAAAYRWVVSGGFEPVPMTLAVLAMGAVGVRETLTAMDVRRYARQLAVQTAHFRSLVSGSSDVTLLLDENLVITWQSPSAARHLGLSDQDVLGTPFTALVHPEDVAEVNSRFGELLSGPAGGAEGRPALVEARLRDGFGRWRDTESTISDQRAVPEVGTLVVHLRDVSERKDLERTLHQLAFTDQLTGLANRRELLRTVAALRTVPDQAGAVLILDLDGFSAVNDVRGHEIGDAVLIEVARRLRTGAGDADLPARLGGDEFAVLTPTNPVQAYALATRLLTQITQGCTLPGMTVKLSVSVGMADINCAGGVDEVMRRAELALRRAKQLGRGRVEWYDETIEAAMARRMTLERELPGLVGRGELDLVYQPIVDLASRRPVGVEALLRWRHPRLGTVAPADFIPVAEDLGLVDEIGAWVLNRACGQLSNWLRDGRELWMTVNVSASQLATPGFVSAVARALGEHSAPAESLIVEIAERDVGTASGQRVVAQLAGLRALGVRTALDHFGTGPTSLAHLRRLPVDILKIDRVLFAEPAARADPAAPIIDVLVSLGRRLGLEIVVQGLETEAHLETVRDAGCRYGQGHLFVRPSPAEHVEAYLESHRSPSL